ncbi:MAG TPA: hypothetical protein VGB09_09800 [Candidatus Binatia bacterium]|jgi:hypothetical protein
MKPGRRQRNKKKFASAGSLRRPKGTTVKIKPKEEEPCRTRNPRPKIKTPALDADRRKIFASFCAAPWRPV